MTVVIVSPHYMEEKALKREPVGSKQSLGTEWDKALITEYEHLLFMSEARLTLWTSGYLCDILLLALANSS